MATGNDAEGFLGRINHPVFGAFATSWIIWNWEIIYLFFHGLNSPFATISAIKIAYLNWANYKSLIVEPAIVSGAFIIVSPALSDAYTLYKSWVNHRLNKWEPIAKIKVDSMIEEREIKTVELNQRIGVLNVQILKSQAENDNEKAELKRRGDNWENGYKLIAGKTVAVPGQGLMDVHNMAANYLNTLERIRTTTEALALAQKNNDRIITENELLKMELVKTIKN